MNVVPAFFCDVKQIFTIARFLLQRRSNQFETIEVVDNEDVLIVGVSGDGLQLGLPDVAYTDGKDSDALVA